MEPEEIQKLYQTIHTYDVLRTQQDLSRVSTKDLLNECYRRRAIEKFAYSTQVQLVDLDPQYQTEIREHALRELGHGLWESMMSHKNFYPDAMIVTERVDNYRRASIFVGEVYVCKHPTKVKK